MEPRPNVDLFVLLEDYGRSIATRASRTRSSDLPGSDRPIWLLTDEFGARQRWQSSHGPAPAVVPVLAGRPPELEVARFDPFSRYRRAPGNGTWPPDKKTPLELQIGWESGRFHEWRPHALGASVLMHMVMASLLMVPGTMQLDMSEPADWDAVRITLATPPLDDLPPLDGPSPSKLPGDADDGFRGLPAPEPDPGPAASSELPPSPDPATEAEVTQPLVPEEPEEAEESTALADEQQPEPEEAAPLAKSPAPAEFQEGTELAQARDPRLLPMPKAPTRKRAVLQLETPKAAMPSRQGSAQAGTLELTARPDQVIEGAIRQMIHGGGARQAVGTGFSGIPSTETLPSGPAEPRSMLELLSDPRGVDFRPYLTQVLAAVRRNWLAVVPESARLGMSRGRTLIQFSVARNGSVPKLVIAKSSGTSPLDRAAVAGISASNPFPPLPSEYLGQDIRLQFTFLYNIRNP